MTTAERETYTPESLLSVAVQVFNERGYDGTSMEHLSKAAGISKSSIYHHVAGKEELLRRAVSRALDGLFGILDEERACEGRPVERLIYRNHPGKNKLPRDERNRPMGRPRREDA